MSRGKKVLYLHYSDPSVFPPLEHGAAAFAAAGCRVTLLGTHISKDHSFFMSPIPGVRLYRMAYCAAGTLQKLHYVLFAVWTLVWTLAWRPDVLYVSDPITSPVGWLVSRFTRARLVYHEHDGYAGERAFARIILGCRRRLASRALCIVPCDERADAMRAELPGARVIRVWNCASRNEVLPAPLPRRCPPLLVVYSGTISPWRLPVSVLEALARCPEVRLRVIGYAPPGSEAHLRRFRSEAERLRVSGRVEMVDFLTHADVVRSCAEALVGLAFASPTPADDNERWMAGASNKPFDYLASATAVLVTDLPEWRALYVGPGYGTACDPRDPASIAAAFRWFLEHPDETRRMGVSGRERVLRDWNYETEFAPVLAAVLGEERR